MNTKLILDHQEYYLLLDLDAEIKKNDWFFNTYVSKFYKNDLGLRVENDHEFKIIGYYPKKDAPKLEGVPLMKELNENVDVDKIAKDFIDKNLLMENSTLDKTSYRLGVFDGCQLGYKAASDKKFSVEDMIEFAEYQQEYQHHTANNNFQTWILKKSLTKEKEEIVDYEVEMEELNYSVTLEPYDPTKHSKVLQPKIENEIIYGKWITK